jgi:SAM-dependent methyltransferase
MDMKNYWDERLVKSSNSIGSFIKQSRLTQGLTNILFSVRSSDEIFIARTLRERGVRSVLDVACGLGKAVIPSIADYTAGVDIAGYPTEITLSKGYNECVQYDAPEYDFAISRQVDAITCINLNAHVSFAAYQQIIKQALRFLRPGGIVILINEYDNDGISYRLLHRNKDKFDRLVRWMEHWHYEYEADFTKKFQAAFGSLKLTSRKPLIADLLPSLHYYVYYTGHNPPPAFNRPFIISDIPLSIVNYALSLLSPRFNKSFIVAYVYEHSHAGNESGSST